LPETLECGKRKASVTRTVRGRNRERFGDINEEPIGVGDGPLKKILRQGEWHLKVSSISEKKFRKQKDGKVKKRSAPGMERRAKKERAALRRGTAWGGRRLVFGGGGPNKDALGKACDSGEGTELFCRAWY